jgi:O-acetyl-ADP-ribose deacetylase
MRKFSIFIGILLQSPIWCSPSCSIGNTTVTVIQGDITSISGHDAIVNAANTSLHHNGGVARAIARAAGKKLQQYCMTLPSMGLEAGEKCNTGQAVITPSFKLAKNGVKHIIHAIGPRIPQGTNPTTRHKKQLYGAYYNSLLLAYQHGCKSIAFPAISTAIFGYDIKQATPIALQAICDFIKQNPNALETITLVVFSTDDYNVYVNTLSSYLSEKSPTLSVSPRFAPVSAWMHKKLS